MATAREIADLQAEIARLLVQILERHGAETKASEKRHQDLLAAVAAFTATLTEHAVTEIRVISDLVVGNARIEGDIDEIKSRLRVVRVEDRGADDTITPRHGTPSVGPPAVAPAVPTEAPVEAPTLNRVSGTLLAAPIVIAPPLPPLTPLPGQFLISAVRQQPHSVAPQEAIADAKSASHIMPYIWRGLRRGGHVLWREVWPIFLVFGLPLLIGLVRWLGCTPPQVAEVRTIATEVVRVLVSHDAGVHDLLLR